MPATSRPDRTGPCRHLAPAGPYPRGVRPSPVRPLAPYPPAGPRALLVLAGLIAVLGLSLRAQLPVSAVAPLTAAVLAPGPQAGTDPATPAATADVAAPEQPASGDAHLMSAAAPGPATGHLRALAPGPGDSPWLAAPTGPAAHAPAGTVGAPEVPGGGQASLGPSGCRGPPRSRLAA